MSLLGNCNLSLVSVGAPSHLYVVFPSACDFVSHHVLNCD